MPYLILQKKLGSGAAPSYFNVQVDSSNFATWQDVDVDTSGNVYTSGFHDSGAARDVILGKFDTTLNGSLFKQIDGTTNNDDISPGISIDNSDNVFVILNSYDTGEGRQTPHILKMDSSFNISAQKRCDTTGTGESPYFRHMEVPSDDTVYVVGWSYGTVFTNAGAYIARFSNDLSTVTMKGLNGSGNDYFYYVAEKGGTVYAAGFTDTPANRQCLIAKYDANLVLQTHKFVNDGSIDQRFRAVTADSSGNVYAVGENDTGGIIVKFDSNLNILAQKEIAGALFLGANQPSGDNIYAVGLDGTNKGLIVQFDTSLNIVQQATLDGAGASDVLHKACLNGGRLRVVGDGASASSTDAVILDLYNGDLSSMSGSYLGWTMAAGSHTASTPSFSASAGTLSDVTQSISPTNSSLSATALSMTESQTQL